MGEFLGVPVEGLGIFVIAVFALMAALVKTTRT